MAATLDDLVLVGTAIQVDLRVLLTSIESKIGAGTGNSSPKKTAESSSFGSQFLSGLGAGVQKLIEPFSAASKGIISFGLQLKAFVSQFNPSAVIRFDLALGSLQATLGRALTPVLEKITQIIQKLADGFASLSPAAQQFAVALATGAAIGPIIAGVALAVKALIASFGILPVILGTLASMFVGLVATMSSGAAIGRFLDSVMKTVGTILESLAIAFDKLASAIDLEDLLVNLAAGFENVAKVIKDFFEVIELGGEDYDPRKRKGDLARRPAQFESISSFANKAYSMAYSGASVDAPKESLKVLREIHGILKERLPAGGGHGRGSGAGVAAAALFPAGAIAPVIAGAIPAIGICRELYGLATR